MCGIFGYFDRRRLDMDAGQMANMSASLHHRGPNDDGIFQHAGSAIGNRRLAIIDIAGGHQPCVSPDGQVALVQNGEIYNYIELDAELRRTGFPARTKSDTEVLLQLYLRDGPSFIHQLNGMFAIAILDKRRHRLLLFRDRLGVKPLFFADDGQRLIFASEIKALIRAGWPVKVSDEALHHFLTFNYVPPPHTLFQGIRHLMPGEGLEIGGHGVQRDQWWRLTGRANRAWTEAEAKAEFLALLDDATRIRLRADVPFGAFLSGGIDSSTVTGLMSMHMREPVRTYSIGFNEHQFDETPYALAASRRFGTDHHTKRAEPDLVDLLPIATYYCDQPHGDMSFLPTYLLSELAVRDVTMVLTGDGADELFAGYDKYRDFFAALPTDCDDESIFRGQWADAVSLFSEGKRRQQLYHPAFARRIEGVSSRSIVDDILDESADADRVNQVLYFDTKLLLPGNNLVKPDRMAMAHSLECRSPFMDYRVVELAFSFPGHFKLRNGQTKYIYKRAVEPLIGSDLSNRQKRMFTVPIGEWFRTKLASYCRSMLLGDRAFSRQLFEPQEIRRLVDSHIDGNENNTRELRALLAIEVWMRIFVDNEIPHGVGYGPQETKARPSVS